MASNDKESSQRKPSPSTQSTSASSSEPKKRINTQIHRRSKAKAVYPLSSEWEDGSPLPPKQLRMPSSKIGKTDSGRTPKSK
ncbi:MAG: hypothetical protein MRJ96_04340 [Nitrospirales bacterium]|nr:hypothetical protein [Nitrospirales bacterium]